MSDQTFRLRLKKVAAESPPGEFYEIRLESVEPDGGVESPPESPPAAGVDHELKKFEYERAQEMLQHYDNLTWHIGSILIAGVLVLTGLGLGNDGFEVVTRGWKSLVVVYGLPAISFLVLSLWALWFRRMRSHYQYRDEVMHRLELDLKMYHFLRIVEANNRLRSPADENLRRRLDDARRAAWGAGEGAFEPMVNVRHSGPPSYKLVWGMAFLIPLIQLIGLFVLWVSNMWERARNPVRLGLAPWDEVYVVGTWSLWAHAAVPTLLFVLAFVAFRRATRG